MRLKFYNTLARKIEEFKPIKPSRVGFYACGPTVYGFAHIGNFRTYIFEDFLRRVLIKNGYQSKHVVNITDVEDKIIRKLSPMEKSQNDSNGHQLIMEKMKKLTGRYERIFYGDLNKLNIMPADVYPRATEHVPQMIGLITDLLKKGYAYQAEDKSIYFNISKFAGYGQLSGLNRQELQAGASGRVMADEYAKEDASDFVLWKARKVGEPFWTAPFGHGRPGWHIECSAMSMHYLGASFDIHAGAVDLIFPHHEDEIAQSEAATGKKFVKFWLEGEHLLVDGAKMAKSKGNFYTLRDIERRGFDPLTFRYLCLTAHYRSKLNFTWKSLTAAQKALKRLKQQVANLKRQIERSEKGPWQGGCAEYEQNFLEAVNSDLDAPKALSLVWELLKTDYPARLKLPTLLGFDQVLGLRLSEEMETVSTLQIPQTVQKLAEEREDLRQAGKFKEADELRGRILKMGFAIEDTPKGFKLGAKNC